MKLHALTLLALLPLCAPCDAGESQGTDLSAGYSFARIDDGDRHGANAALGFDLFGPIDGPPRNSAQIGMPG